MANAQMAVTVDEKFARFGSKSYAISQITSVGLGETRKARWPWVACAFFAACFWLGAIGADEGARTGIGLMAVIFTIAAIRFYQRKNDYHLVLATAGGEVQPTSSTNAEEIIALRDAIEAEIAKR